MTAIPVRSDVSVADIELFADDLDPARAAAIYKEQGCLVVRGLMKPYLDTIAREIETVAQTALSLLDRAQRITEGWVTPDGALFLPAPSGYPRDKQIMLLPFSYRSSATFLQSALDPKTLDIVQAIVGPDIELFDNGQCLYKEPVGGHPKHLHQDFGLFRASLRGAGRNFKLCGGHQSGQWRTVCGSRIASDGHAVACGHVLAPGAG